MRAVFIGAAGSMSGAVAPTDKEITCTLCDDNTYLTSKDAEVRATSCNPQPFCSQGEKISADPTLDNSKTKQLECRICDPTKKLWRKLIC